MKRRTAIFSIVAALSLSAAGYAAAHGRHEGWGHVPSTIPPTQHWHGHGYGHDGDHGHHGHDR